MEFVSPHFVTLPKRVSCSDGRFGTSSLDVQARPGQPQAGARMLRPTSRDSFVALCNGEYCRAFPTMPQFLLSAILVGVVVLAVALVALLKLTLG
jgi:hypothetical protein